MKTLILGASTNPDRYSYKAANRLLEHGHQIILAGVKRGEINGHSIIPMEQVDDVIDTVTLYVNPSIQKMHYEKILSLKPRRIIFNPGTENEELKKLAHNNGIETIEACTLVMLSTGQY
jgi:predicted CoA-binding protein